MKVSYIRVSTAEQNTARQEEAMQGLGIEKTFIEKISGKNTERPELNNMLDFIRTGDIVYIESFSRLARNTKDLINLVEQIQRKGASIVSLKEGFDLTTPAGRMMLTMMGALYQFELECSAERRQEGIEIAKKEGKYKGRKKIEINDKFINAYNRFFNRKIGVSEAMQEAGIKSRTTWYSLVKEYKAQEGQQPKEAEVKKEAEIKEYVSTQSTDWIKTGRKKINQRIKRKWGINIKDIPVALQDLKVIEDDNSIMYDFRYEGERYQVEYLKNSEEIEFAIVK